MSDSEDKADPIKDPEFKRVLHNLLSTPHKTQSELRKDRAGKTARKAKGRHVSGANAENR
jgi:hypothetical protein